MLVTAAATLVHVSARADGAASPVLFDRIVAVVDDDVILRSEVVAQARPLALRIPEAERSPQTLTQLRRELLERMIDDLVVAREAARLELTATEAEVDTAIEYIAKQNGLSTVQLAEEVQKQGLTLPAYQAEVRRQLIDAKWVAYRVRPRLQTPAPKTPEEEKAYAAALEVERKKAVAELRTQRWVEVRW